MRWYLAAWIALTVGLFVTAIFVSSGRFSTYRYEEFLMAAPPVTYGQKDDAKDWLKMKPSPYYNVLNKVPKTRIVFIGAGPTTLGALYRLYDIGVLNITQIQILVFEKEAISGVESVSNHNGFPWDNGGPHSMSTSQYKYFNEAVDTVVHWDTRQQQEAYVFMKGEKGETEFVSLENTVALKKKVRKGKVNRHRVFMREYFRKLWTLNKTNDMNNIAKQGHSAYTGRDGLNHYPQLHRGTGGIWNSITDMLPRGWFNYDSNVTEIDLGKKQLTLQIGKKALVNVDYDIIVSTIPIHSLVQMIKDNDNNAHHKKRAVNQLLYNHVHIIGLGLSGKPPKSLQNKSHIYFPNSDVLFHHATVFSSCAGNCAHSKNNWSMMFEIAQPKTSPSAPLWTKDDLLQQTITAMEQYGFIKSSQVVSHYYNLIDHGYPIPSIKRNDILTEVQPWLESRSIYSRGLLGGWLYEVGSLDYSFMQGVEIVDRVLLNVPEQIYSIKSERKMSLSNEIQPRTFVKETQRLKDYEFVIARYIENVEWMLPYAEHTHIYNKGSEDVIPDFRFQLWTNLQNVGKEGHTYLYHIVNNYNTLADVTVFLQGELKKGERRRCYAEDLFQYVVEARNKGIGFAAYHFVWKWNWPIHRRSDVDSYQNDTAGEYWDRYFEFPHPKRIIANYYGCISVSRERIQRRPRKMYEELMNSLAYSDNPQEGYFVEKFWVSLFSLFKNPM